MKGVQTTITIKVLRMENLGRITDLTGSKFGRLTVTSFAGRRKGKAHWNCLCTCGSKVQVEGGNLRSGHSKSCGCLRLEATVRTNTKHGLSTDPTYSTWRSMIARCTNPNHNRSKYYMERGITVAPEWLEFEQFLADMGPRPEGLTLERLDNEKGYEKDNCAWVTQSEQLRNRRPLRTGPKTRTGVYRTKYETWEAKIGIRGKSVHLGTFKTYEEAVSARESAEKDYGFHRSY